jgi:hypothetical protein
MLMKDAQKPDHISLATLVGRLSDGRFVIPDFQRDFEWEPWDISALMRSIFLDYYIGSLLLWKGKQENFNALACEPIYAFANGKGAPEHIVLDGQQRLTAMYYAFMAPNAPAPKRANRFLYFIKVDKFVEKAYDEAFIYDWTRRGENLAEDPAKQYENHLFPLAVIGKTIFALFIWLQGYERYWLDKEKQARDAGNEQAAQDAQYNVANAQSFGEHLRGIMEQYQVAYIELDRDLELDKVCDIFTQINSRGIRLDVFDLMNALLRPRGLQLRYMWREAAPRLSFVNTDRMNVYILQVMSILRQAYCSPNYLYYLLPGQERQVREPGGSLRKEVLVPDIADFELRWSQAVTSLEQAIKLLRHPQEFGAISSQYLPYVSILPAFAALQTEARRLPHHRQLDAQRKIRHWYWASVFLNRYSGAVESTSARDYLDVKSWFDDDVLEPGLIAEFRERFRNIDLRREVRRGTSVYNGIFNLLILGGARDWVTGNLPQHDDLHDHHIVPQSWRRDVNLGTPIDTILNRTPLTGETNRNVIGDRLPYEYLPELIEANGEEAIRKILESHFISPVAFDILLRKPFTPSDFEAFLTERQRTIQDAIEDLLVKARLDLPLRLREIDAEIENVELCLRAIITAALANDPAQLPSHIQQKIAERLQTAAKKNPAMNMKEYDGLSSQLEYADLRELQAVLVTGALWPVFQSRFGNKEAVAIRFNQLAELRNSIRHSRKVTEVARKDGEAAILWFKQVLAS